MEHLGKLYLKRKGLRSHSDVLRPEHAARQEQRHRNVSVFNETHEKGRALRNESSIEFVPFTGDTIIETCNEIAKYLELNGSCLLGLQDSTAENRIGHMVAFIKLPNGDIEFFDSMGLSLDEYGGEKDPTTPLGFGNPNILVRKLRKTYNLRILTITPPPEYLRNANERGLQLGENMTCSYQCLFRAMNRTLDPLEYYTTLHNQVYQAHHGDIKYYDAYMIQMINDMFDARQKVFSGKSFEIDFMHGNVIPYSVLKIANVSDNVIHALRLEESKHLGGEQWRILQDEKDILDFVAYLEWAKEQYSTAQLLWAEGVLDEPEHNHIKATYVQAREQYDNNKEAIEELIEQNEIINSYQTADVPDISPEEQAAIDKRARELAALVPTGSEYAWRGFGF